MFVLLQNGYVGIADLYPHLAELQSLKYTNNIINIIVGYQSKPFPPPRA